MYSTIIRPKIIIPTVLLSFILLMGNRGSHPVSGGGYTGAPGDGVCGQCHTGNNASLQGDLFIDNLPATVDQGQTYTLTARLTNPSVNSFRGGFQMVIMDNNDNSVGSYSNLPSNANTKNSGGNTYVGHSLETRFDGNTEISWTFDWTAPSTGTNGTNITFYYTAILGNGGNGNSNDRFLIQQTSAPYQGTTSPLTAMLTQVNDSPCANEDGGYAKVMASNGTPPYFYNWSNGENGEEAFALPVGTNDVTVTDSGTDQEIINFNIGSPPLLELNIVEVNPAPCNGIDGGSATVAGQGGVGSYDYQWPGGLSGPTQNNLSVGTYIVTLTDGNNCQTTNSLTIDAIPILSISENSSNNPSCLGSSDGNIDVDVSGGSSPLNYSWSTGLTTEDIDNIPAGSYTLIVSDNNNCTASFTKTLIDGPQILIDPNSPVVDADCFNQASGSISPNISGGVGPYDFAWNSGENVPILLDIFADTYTVTVSDQNQCTSSATFVVNEPDQLIGMIGSKKDVTCSGGNDGEAFLFALGGTSPYNFNWPNGGDGTELFAGIYQVTVSDANNCTSLKQVNIIELSTPLVIGVSTTSESVVGAEDGTATVIQNGGLSPFSYMWNTGDTLSSISNLASGEYAVTVTDSLGCTGFASGFVTSGSCILTASATVKTNDCFGDSLAEISLDIMNVVPDNSILWSNGDTTPTISNLPSGSYSVSISDVNGCFFLLTAIQVVDPPLFDIDIVQLGDLACSDGASKLTISSLDTASIANLDWSIGSHLDTVNIDSAGTYSLVAMDTSGCISFDTIEVFGIDTLPPTFNNVDSILYIDVNGMVEVTVLNERVDDNCGLDSISLITVGDLDCATSSNFGILVYARDVNNNIFTDSVPFMIQDTFAPAISCLDTIIQFSCDTIQHEWAQAIDNCGIDTLFANVDHRGTLLDVGIYNMLYTSIDRFGNSATCVSTIIVESGIAADISAQNISCFGAADGSIFVDNIQGGTPPYSIEYVGVLVPDNLFPGIYHVNVTDSLGCLYKDSVTISNPTIISLDTSVVNDETASGDFDGSIGVIVSGGTGNLTFTWRNDLGETISSNTFVTGISAGTYTLTVEDENQCQETFTFIVDRTTSTFENELDALVKVYPNPVLDHLFVEKPASLLGHYSILSMEGKVISKGSISNPKIDVRNLQKGSYFIKIQNADDLIIKRFVKL